MAVSENATKWIPGKVRQPDGTEVDGMIEVAMTPEEIATLEKELAVEREQALVAEHEREVQEARERLTAKQNALNAAKGEQEKKPKARAAKRK